MERSRSSGFASLKFPKTSIKTCLRNTTTTRIDYLFSSTDTVQRARPLSHFPAMSPSGYDISIRLRQLLSIIKSTFRKRKGTSVHQKRRGAEMTFESCQLSSSSRPPGYFNAQGIGIRRWVISAIIWGISHRCQS